MRRLPLLLIAMALLFSAVPAASGQTLLSLPSEGCVWHVGDDARWALPAFDDAGWASTAQWSSLATPNARLWLRCRFRPESLARAVTPVLQVTGDLAYSVYVDGSMVGGSGNIATGEHMTGRIGTFSLPPASLPDHGMDNAGRRPMLVAVRMTFTPEVDEQQPLPQLWLGDGELLRGNYLRQVDRAVRAKWLTYASGSLIGSAGLFFLALYWLDRRQRYLLWISLICFGVVVLRGNELLCVVLAQYPSRLESFLYAIGQPATALVIQFMFALNRKRVPLLFRIVQGIELIQDVGLLLAVFLPADWAMPLRWIVEVNDVQDYVVVTALITGSLAPFFAFPPLRTLRGSSMALYVVCCVWGLADFALYFVQYPFLSQNFLGFFFAIQPYRSIAIAGVIVALTVLLVQRLRASNQKQAELAGEMKAAQQIQRMLVPETLEAQPGLILEVAFRPMREVGGDFYLCRPLKDGRQRLLLGDVSGKGTAAALTAALIIGAADRRESDSPTELLRHLNLVLCKSRVGGFATCICADFEPGGLVRIANAGHLSPYRRGKELSAESGLPLGIVETAEPSEISLQLDPGDRLTFMTDGVVEARSKSGELMGFERMAELSVGTAEAIADAAQAFGQDDDITVLTVRFAGLEGMLA